MQRLISTRKDLPSQLTRTIFADRGHQFVERLQWGLCVTPKGYEVDEYDDEHSEYLAVHQNGNHLGSCRVRPITQSTMIADHFLPNFPEAVGFLEMQKGRLFELTRFCRTPSISVADSRHMLEHLAILLDTFRDERRLTGFVAVVFPQVARFLDSIGVRYIVISKSSHEGKPIFMICITHAVRIEKTTQPNLPQTPASTPYQLVA